MGFEALRRMTPWPSSSLCLPTALWKGEGRIGVRWWVHGHTNNTNLENSVYPRFDVTGESYFEPRSFRGLKAVQLSSTTHVLKHTSFTRVMHVLMATIFTASDLSGSKHAPSNSSNSPRDAKCARTAIASAYNDTSTWSSDSKKGRLSRALSKRV